MRWLVFLLVACDPTIHLIDERADASIPAVSKCAGFDFDPIQLDVAATGMFVDRGRWNLITRDGRWLDIPLIGDPSVRPRLQDLAGLTVFDAVAERRRLFVVGERRAMGWVYEIALPTLETTTSTVLGPRAIAHLDVLGDEVWGVGHENHRGGAIQVGGAGLVLGGEPLDTWPGAVAIAGDGFVYLGPPDDRFDLWVRPPGSNQIRPLPLGLTTPERITTLKRIDGGRVVGGTTRGRLLFLDGLDHRFEETGFLQLSEAPPCEPFPTHRSVQAIEGFRNGFIFMNCSHVGQWYPDLSCDPIPFPQPRITSPSRLRRLGDSAFLAAGVNDALRLRARP